MAKYQKYAEYKDFGEDFLPALPLHWEVNRVKKVLTMRRSIVGSDSKSYQLLSLTLKGIIPRDISNGEGKIPESFDTYQAVKTEDLVFCLFDMDETPRTIGIAQEDGMITGAYNVYNVNKLNFPKFVYYYFLHLDYFKGLKPFYTGLRKVVRSDTFANIKMPCPTLDEQTQIANFLDHETAKIDTLIAKQEKLIELLKEKRQAVISHAVTKGLNPNVPMKDSGVEWLGEVPEHWDAIKLKYVVTHIVDAEHKTAPYFDDGQYLVCRTTNVRDGKLRLDGGKYTDYETYTEWTQRAIPEVGDVLFTREAPAGEACIYDGEVPLCLGQRMVLFKLNKNLIFPEFLLYSLYSGLADDFIKQLSQGSTVVHFNMADIQNIPLFDLPLVEQKQIVEYLSSELKKHDALIQSAESAIQLMQERRTALISAAVTGKIDVRHHASRPMGNDNYQTEVI